ncbi:MAG: DNA modification methylase [Deltaproteobacteria bacterium RIFCSPLOWO2_02_FULL_53_8]|nr:MAG: DNA modification methylase [Deltaproteobacteria bacterium RIFCSPLOWO2_02_FULL_53_8]
MTGSAALKHPCIQDYLTEFVYLENDDLFGRRNTIVEYREINNKKYLVFVNEFWTSKQRQANSLHEIAYRACFKPQLPRFFIELLTKSADVVYDPFSGRGTTVIEAALCGRNIIANDINPISRILTKARLFIPDINALEDRLRSIPFNVGKKADIDLSMFYHPDTEAEIVSLRDYLREKHEVGTEDELDLWIRMAATNRLTGHSSGFFSVYTLPPNQAVSQESQRKINIKRHSLPEYRNTVEIILRKTRSLLGDVTPVLSKRLRSASKKALFLCEDARYTSGIKDDAVQLTVTSPPFLDIVQYDDDNWLRCWFNSIDVEETGSKITMSKKIEDWCVVMGAVFDELFRITSRGGHVAFEVGEVRGGSIRLDEHVVPLGLSAGFEVKGIMINEQAFTKTANIWGVSNNTKGTNTNRIVIFEKPS